MAEILEPVLDVVEKTKEKVEDVRDVQDQVAPGSKAYLLKELRRSQVGHIVYIDKQYAYVTKLDETNLLMSVTLEDGSSKDLDFTQGERTSRPLPLPIPKSLLSKRNEYMYELKKRLMQKKLNK
jgi:hypothetical protein